MPAAIDLTGQSFGCLTVIRKLPAPTRHGNYRWECVCSCGVTTTVTSGDLRTRHTKSCGCLRHESNPSNRRGRTHGMSTTPAYQSWSGMRDRCLNKDNRAYPRYGGRGITICDRWSSFQNFLDDMGPRPDDHTLDRIDNNGPYSPDNCRWALWTQQNRNTRANRRLTFQGRTQPIVAWAEETGINHGVIRNRLRLGWPVEKALTAAVEPRHRRRPDYSATAV
jgi:hypothetical protein